MSDSNEKNNNNENKEEKSSENEQQKIILMKKGDYSVHIYLEELKNLIQISEDELPKPIVKIICFNQTKRTQKPEEKCVNYTIDEHLYFEQTNLTVEQLDSSKIVIEVYDSEN